MGIISYKLLEKPYRFFEYEGCRLFDLETDEIVAEILIPDNLRFSEGFLHYACKTLAARLMGISYDEYDDICEEYGIGNYELPDIFYDLMEDETLEIEGLDNDLEDDWFDSVPENEWNDFEDFFKGSDAGSKEDPSYWDPFFGDEGYGDDMDDY